MRHSRQTKVYTKIYLPLLYQCCIVQVRTFETIALYSLHTTLHTTYTINDIIRYVPTYLLLPFFKVFLEYNSVIGEELPVINC